MTFTFVMDDMVDNTLNSLVLKDLESMFMLLRDRAVEFQVLEKSHPEICCFRRPRISTA